MVNKPKIKNTKNYNFVCYVLVGLLLIGLLFLGKPDNNITGQAQRSSTAYPLCGTSYGQQFSGETQTSTERVMIKISGTRNPKVCMNGKAACDTKGKICSHIESKSSPNGRWIPSQNRNCVDYSFEDTLYYSAICRPR